MKILSVTSEIYPLIKTGGLADVAGALPLALEPLGIDTITLVPGYSALLAQLHDVAPIHLYDDLLGEKAVLLRANHGDLKLIVLRCPALYERTGGPYLDIDGLDYHDNWKRFGALSKAGADIAQGLVPDLVPDLVHVHDWQSAMVPVFMRYGEKPEIPSLITIHNIAFQGNFAAHHMADLGLPDHAFWESLEYWGGLSFLKGGLLTASAISTVSPSYASEILTRDYGMGLEGVVTLRQNALYGIVNGIDDTVWNPQHDALLAEPYSAQTLKKRKANRKLLERHFNLIEDDGPIFCVISRLTWQKGMDVLALVVDDLVADGARLVVLGSGEPEIQRALGAAALRHPGRVAVQIGYNEPLSHLMQAGADAIIIPSRFEPCGLTQLYGLRYGCVPVVSRTGGLNDTIIDANEAGLAAKAATGIQFASLNEEGLRQALRRAIRLFRDTKTWQLMQKQGMKADISWAKSAARYCELYNRLLEKG